MATHNPAASIGGHVAVDLHSLAEVPVDGDGVDAAQRVSIHQVLGTVLRVSKDPATCEIKKKAKFKPRDILSTCLGPFSLQSRKSLTWLLQAELFCKAVGLYICKQHQRI